MQPIKTSLFQGRKLKFVESEYCLKRNIAIKYGAYMTKNVAYIKSNQILPNSI